LRYLKRPTDPINLGVLKINGIGRAKTAQIMVALELGRGAVSKKNGSNFNKPDY